MSDYAYSVLVILSVIGFIMGLVVLIKGPKKYSWVLHLLFTIFLPPIEIIFASLEIQDMNKRS